MCVFDLRALGQVTQVNGQNKEYIASSVSQVFHPFLALCTPVAFLGFIVLVLEVKATEKVSI